ncbi:RNA 3'-terminal phosphate cyclase-like protein [Nymphon striatum]|nr:RNA 3'-terminal phosphate cyclase-like protein [Nymphon striatum]
MVHLEFEGANYLRQRLILSTLSGQSIRIRNIRSTGENPGVNECEASLIRLLDKITNGSRIEVNETGTNLYYCPGLLHGGEIDHDCCMQRSIAYYLEVLMCLAPFCKEKLSANLHGVTNNKIDPSIDSMKASMLPTIKHFIFDDEGLELKIINRGLPPAGGGHVLFQCPIKKQLRPIQLTDPGKIKRIRGVAFACRVSPTISNRIIDAAKGVLLKFIPDVYLISDHRKGPRAGKSPGFGISLVAETKQGSFITADVVSNDKSSEELPSIPEDLGISGAHLLLEEIYRGGCVDSINQGLACLFMTLGQKDISKLQTGPLSPYCIGMLQHIRTFLNISFKLEKISNTEELRTGASKVQLTCLGEGFSNISKRIL